MVAGMPTNTATAVQPLLGAITIMGSGRLGPTFTALVGVIGTVIGGVALRRATLRRATRDAADVDRGARQRHGATAAIVLGSVSVALGVLFLVTADGGPGTGNGVVGSAVALILGPSAIILGGVARGRRREPRPA
jgi:hypothetical protein